MPGAISGLSGLRAVMTRQAVDVGRTQHQTASGRGRRTSIYMDMRTVRPWVTHSPSGGGRSWLTVGAGFGAAFAAPIRLWAGWPPRKMAGGDRFGPMCRAARLDVVRA